MFRLFYVNYSRTYNRAKDNFDHTSQTGFLWRYWIRPVSFLITPFFLMLGLTPNLVTVLGLIFSLLGLLLLLPGTWIWWLVGSLIYQFAVVLDAVDGNIARANDKATYFGKFLDGAVDALVISIMPIFYGMSLYLSTDKIFLLCGGLSTGFFWLFAEYIRARFSFHREWYRADTLKSVEWLAQIKDLDSKAIIPQLPSDVLFDSILIALILATIDGLREYVFGVVVLIMVVDGILKIISQFELANRLLSVHRTSRHANTVRAPEEKSV